MFRAAIIFFVLGLIGVLLGAYNFAGLSFEAGRIILLVFLALAVLSFIVALFTGRRPKSLP